MCLMLYLGSTRPIPLTNNPLLSVEEVRAEESAVKQWFGDQNVYFIGSHSGCSCGFPSVKAEQPLPYYEGMFDDDDPTERHKDLQSTELLVALIRQNIADAEPLLLYPVWSGEEGSKPIGRIKWILSSLDPNTLVFTQDFMYEVVAQAPTNPRDPEKSTPANQAL